MIKGSKTEQGFFGSEDLFSRVTSDLDNSLQDPKNSNKRDQLFPS